MLIPYRRWNVWSTWILSQFTQRRYSYRRFSEVWLFSVAWTPIGFTIAVRTVSDFWEGLMRIIICDLDRSRTRYTYCKLVTSAFQRIRNDPVSEYSCNKPLRPAWFNIAQGTGSDRASRSPVVQAVSRSVRVAQCVCGVR